MPFPSDLERPIGAEGLGLGGVLVWHDSLRSPSIQTAGTAINVADQDNIEQGEYGWGMENEARST